MRIFSDGAEYQDILFWSHYKTPQIAAGRISGSCYRIGGDFDSYAQKDFTGLSELYFRCAGQITVTGWDVIEFRNGGTTIFAIGWDALHHIYANVGGVTVGTSTNVYDHESWTLFEIYYLLSDAGGRFVVKVNGIPEIDYTGDTKPDANTTVDNIYSHVGGFTIYLDDIALNSTDNSDGKNDNSWCGDEHYEFHPAASNGDINDWTGSDGDKVNNYALVDEVPPTGDTDYVLSDTPTQQDMYGISSFTDTNKIVTRVWAECRARDSNASAGEIKIGFKTGGAVYLCSTDKVLQNVYTRIVGDEAKVNPADSAIWEKADIDALQFVTECE